MLEGRVLQLLVAYAGQLVVIRIDVGVDDMFFWACRFPRSLGRKLPASPNVASVSSFPATPEIIAPLHTVFLKLLLPSVSSPPASL